MDHKLSVSILASGGATAFFPANTQPTFTSQNQQTRLAAPLPVSTTAPVAASASSVVVNGTRQVPINFQTSEEHEETTEGGAKRVFKFRQHFEKETVNSRAVNAGQAREERVVSPPPLFADTPRMAPAPPAPPPPPPPQIPEVFDQDKGTFTFRDRKGRARTVRIGRVVWPPPQEKEAKQQRDVGRLEIDEKVQRELHERIRPAAPVPEPPKVEKKAVSVNALQLLHHNNMFIYV